MSTVLLVAILLGGAHAAEGLPSRVAFGSCADEDKPQPIWEAVVAAEPDLFVFLGDNVYADTIDMDQMRAAYAKLAAKPGFQKLRTTTPLLATWDDHDYGANDAGAEYPMKEASKQIFLDFFDEPADSERRSRPGVYTAATWEAEGHRLQVILLDCRTFRTGLASVADREARKAQKMGIYTPIREGTMLGEDQWRWLEQQLREPADVRLIGTSTQLLGAFNGYEAWANLPHERERMLRLLEETGAGAHTLLLSGDTHWAELSRVGDGDQVLFELTSSGLTETWPTFGPNAHRVGEPYTEANFGMVTIDWEAEPLVTLEVRDVEGRVQITHQVKLPEVANKL
ncbi:MAG: alkaline phosphatase family protein [Deltaproteobacteria bacterium]|nr:alkaline phosphatase family protein [Deltaproteobacteria bacterium]